MKRRDFIRNAIFAGFGVVCGIPLPKKETEWNPSGFESAELLEMDVTVTITGEEVVLKPGESMTVAYVNGYWIKTGK
jgi:hypothetical protein